MAEGTNLITLNARTFSERLKRTWLLLRMLCVIAGACLTALWRNGQTVSFKVTGRPSGPSAIVTVRNNRVTVSQSYLRML